MLFYILKIYPITTYVQLQRMSTASYNQKSKES
jgi:hypothetical protein